MNNEVVFARPSIDNIRDWDIEATELEGMLVVKTWTHEDKTKSGIITAVSGRGKVVPGLAWVYRSVGCSEIKAGDIVVAPNHAFKGGVPVPNDEDYSLMQAKHVVFSYRPTPEEFAEAVAVAAEEEIVS